MDLITPGTKLNSIPSDSFVDDDSADLLLDPFTITTKMMLMLNFSN